MHLKLVLDSGAIQPCELQHNILIGQNAQVVLEWKLGGVDMLAACEAYKKLPGNIWNHAMASTCLTMKAYPTHNPERKQPQIYTVIIGHTTMFELKHKPNVADLCSHKHFKL